MNFNEVTVVTANYNNATLTRIMIMSLLKKQVYPHILIIDNSNTAFFNISPQETRLGISLIDNRNYQLTHNWGVGELSKNHANSLEYALTKVHTKWAVICDNDILFKPSIYQYFVSLSNTPYDIIGEIGYDAVKPDRLFPYLCAINMDRYRTANLHYFDPARCMSLGHDETGNLCHLYDTGYSFYIDALKTNANIKHIKLNDYCVHYLHASQDVPSGTPKPTLSEWLAIHKELC